MSLLDLWNQKRNELSGKGLSQIIAFAGEGKLADGNSASVEFRDFLKIVPSELLAAYARNCLDSSFADSGFALQDITNEVGRRLGFTVEAGRYRGIKNELGFDGIWRSAGGAAVVVEVKTTDAYRIDLNTAAHYRERLIESGQIPEEGSSILIVVGRQDTGDLEAQIRGSKHAWDIRLISVDSLLRLVRIKEGLENPDVLSKIVGILVPQEFTRVDTIVDLVFGTAEDFKEEEAGATEEGEAERPAKRTQKKFVPVNFNEACAARIANVLNVPLVRQSKATFKSPGGEIAVICAVSRPQSRGRTAYWFAFHPHQRELLRSVKTAFVAFGCGSEKAVLLIPFGEFQPWIEGLNVTELENRSYWHVHIREEAGQFLLDRKKGSPRINLTKYLLKGGSP